MMRGGVALKARVNISVVAGVWIAISWLGGCGSNAALPQPDVELRINRLLNLYQAYIQRNQQGPPSEEAFREFAKKLTQKEREDFAIGDDVEGIFVSPRDNQKFTVLYGKNVGAGQNRALIWETTPQNGKRYLALSNLYVVEYDEEMFRSVAK